MMNAACDVLIIGAGQAGLAMGYYLKQMPVAVQIVERYPRIGDSWRNRYDSLVLFTPRAYSALPGLPVPGDPEGYPTKDEFADYLEKYAGHFDLPVVLDTDIRRLDQFGDGFRVHTGHGPTIDCHAVVIATGAFQRSAVPAISQQFSPAVLQLSAAAYKNAAQIPAGTVLVVGDGASGRDIAWELARDHTVILAVGGGRRLLPERILGKSTWWWLVRLGLLRVPGETRLGRYLKKTDSFPGRGKDDNGLLQRGIQIVPRLIEAAGNAATFDNGVTAEVDAVIWATGYRDDADWVAIPAVKDGQGNFVHTHGISPVPGLYFIGRPWQRSRASALVYGVGADADVICAQVTDHLNRRVVIHDTAVAPAGI